MRSNANDTGGSPERFGYEWNVYRGLRAEHEEQFRRWTAPLGQEDWRGVAFLDVGCGMGRNSYWPMLHGAKACVAIDIDDRSLEAARHTLAPFPNARVRRLSAYDIDYADHFDIAFSIGVIHHLERPAEALKAMRRAVKPGGRILIWVYGYENNEWIVRYLNPLRKVLFSRLPISWVHVLSNLPAAALWLGLRLGLGRGEYLRLIRPYPYRPLRAIVFDQMLPRIANYWRREEVEALMRQAGLEGIVITWVNEVSWSALGNRPTE